MVLLAFSLTGCSRQIELDKLHWGHLLGDIAQKYEVPTEIPACTLYIQTQNKFKKRDYVKKLGITKGDGVIEGFLCPPDLDSAKIAVWIGAKNKCLEMGVSKGSISSLKIWESNKLRYEFKGGFYNPTTFDHDSSSSVFGSGVQRVYKDCKAEWKRKKGESSFRVPTEYICVLERFSSFTENDPHFIVREKKYHERESTEGYYKVVEVAYNESDRDNGDTFFADHYYKTELVSSKYFKGDMKEMEPREFMLLEQKPYHIFQSDFIRQGRRWYMALFPQNSEYYCNGIFFTLVDEDFSTLSRESSFSFEISKEPDDDSGGTYCHMNGILNDKENDYTGAFGFCGINANEKAEISIDAPGEITSKSNIEYVMDFAFTHYSYKLTEEQEEMLRGYIRNDIKKRNELEEERLKAMPRRSSYSSSSRSDIGDMHVKCPACHGSGMSSQMPGYRCPGCNGRGTVPYWQIQMRGMP